MASSESELQPELRLKGWADYVDDPDTVCIALYQRMSDLVRDPKVAEYLTQLDQARYGADNFDNATKFCIYASSVARDALFESVFNFLAREGLVVGIGKDDKDPRLDYPVELHVSLASQYKDTELVELLKPARDAIYSNNPLFFPQCLPGTRVGLIKQVLAKINGAQPLEQPLLVAGSTGTGKSALAASILQALKDQHIPVLSFICKHDVPERSNPQFVIPTLAWQLARCPLHRGGVEKALRMFKARSSDVIALSPVHQIELLTTISSLGSPLQRPVILIDALDECGQTASRRQLIKGVIDNTEALCSRFSVVIISRPIDQIETHVRPRTWTVVDLDKLLQSDGTTADLQQFFAAELSELSVIFDISDEISNMVVAANGVFVWARVACSHILLLYDSTDAKNAMNGFCNGLAPAGGSEPLYELYRRTFRDYLFAGSNKMPKQNLDLFRQVIASILFTKVALSAAGIAWLVGRPESAVETLLRHLRPLLAPRDCSSTAPVRLLHASVDDFFRNLAKSDEFFVPPQHAQCFHRCFETMVARLSFNFAGITDPREDMRRRADLEDIRASVSEPLKYACFQWARHLSFLECLESSSLEVVQQFFEGVLLYWLEIVGVFDEVSKAAEWLEKLAEIAGEPLRDISNDASQFLRHYHSQLEHSPCHIYISALPLAQHQSTIAKYYYSSVQDGTFPRITIGLETSRLAPTLIHSSEVLSLEFSPINDTVLTATENAIQVFDSSGAQISSLTLPTSKFIRGYYSATGKMIVGISKGNTSGLNDEDEVEVDMDHIDVAVADEVTLWDTSNYRMIKLQMCNNLHSAGLRLLEYFPERHVALLSGNDRILIAVWDLASPSTRRQELGAFHKVRASRDGSTVLLFRYDDTEGSSLATGSTAELWCAPTVADYYVSMPLPVLLEENKLYDAAISCEGSKLALVCFDDSEIVVVDLKLRSRSSLLAQNPYFVQSVQFTADISHLLVLSHNCGYKVKAYDLEGTVLWSSKQIPAYGPAMSRDGSRFAFIRESDRSKVQICVAGQSTRSSGHDNYYDGPIRSAQFPKCGQQLLIVNAMGWAAHWDPLAGTKLTFLSDRFDSRLLERDSTTCIMSFDGSRFAALNFQGVDAICLNTTNGKVVWKKSYAKGSLYPNDTHFLTMLDAASGDLLEKYVLLDGRLKHIVFSADSSRICGVHHWQEPLAVGIIIWTISDSKPYLQLQAKGSSTGGANDSTHSSNNSTDNFNYRYVAWTSQDTKVVTIRTSYSKSTLTCWDPETCTRLSIVRLSIPHGWLSSRGDLSLLVNLVGPVFGGLELPSWLAESTDQVVEDQDGVRCRDITLLDRWRTLVCIPSFDEDDDSDRLAEYEYPNGSKVEVFRHLERPIVIHYPSEDPWGWAIPLGFNLTFLMHAPISQTFCKTMDGFKMPEGKLAPFFEDKRNTNEPFPSVSEEDFIAEHLLRFASDTYSDAETSVRPASNKSTARLPSLAVAASSHTSIDTPNQGQANGSRKRGWSDWKERFRIKLSKDKGKGKAD